MLTKNLLNEKLFENLRELRILKTLKVYKTYNLWKLKISEKKYNCREKISILEI